MALAKHLETLSVGPGWRVAKVAADAGSVVEWLCRKVGTEGRAVATDLNPWPTAGDAEEFRAMLSGHSRPSPLVWRRCRQRRVREAWRKSTS